MKHFTKILTAFLFTSFVLSQIVVGGNVTDLTTGKPIVGAKVVDMIMKGEIRNKSQSF